METMYRETEDNTHTFTELDEQLNVHCRLLFALSIVVSSVAFGILERK